MTATVSARTPDLTATDARGLPIRQVAYLRTEAGGDVEARITRLIYTPAGHLAEQWDPRLSIPNTCHVHSLSGETVKTASVDSGSRVTLFGLAGQELRHWDPRGNHWSTLYDDQLRPLAVEENGQPGVDTFTYADALADSARNLRGQLIRHDDVSGSIEFNSFGLHGQSLAESRTIADSGTFVSSRTYSPLGAILTQTDAGEHQQDLHYDIAGQLNQVILQLKNGQPEPVLQDAQYNAAGQIEVQIAGNGVRTQWTYDPANGRLCTLTSGKPNDALQQDLHYTYDRMGNILRIEDHTLPTIYFANQRVEGLREYDYDSLYRLISASGFEAEVPNLKPGLPELVQPIDPGRRYSYSEHYTYDTSNNLIELRHQRDGNNFTQHMRIDPHSNRGVRRKPDDPDPDFKELFDPNGNQLYLQDGAPPLNWNARDQLTKVTLLSHSNGLADDEETYLYSQGERVCKRHVTHTRSMTHTREVLYLPGLDIHTRDDGRVLHVISLPLAFGSVRCLHWVSAGPDDLEPDQLRYNLDDHLGSCALELDRHGALISLEFYYAFGGTAWWAARSEVEADYKTIRYSGKEMDCSGLYYYGARYYAPWLWRWICPDPAGDVDGLNLYVFVKNNPVAFVDIGGLGLGDFMDQFIETPEQRDSRKTDSAAMQAQSVTRRNLSDSINRHINILGISKRRALDAQQQILNHRSVGDHALSAARRTAVLLVGQGVSYGAGIAVGVGAQALGAVAPGVGNVMGAALGFGVKKAVSLAVDYVAERTGASASVKLKASKLSPEKIITKAEYKTLNFMDYVKQKFANMNLSSQKNMLKGAKEATGTGAGLILKAAAPDVAGSASAAVSGLLGAVEIAHEVAGAGTELSPEKIAKADSNLLKLIEALNGDMDKLEKDFAEAGVSAMHTFSYFGDNGDTVESLRSATNSVVNELEYTRTMLHSRSRQFSVV
ncbi:insecticidal toxin complex protein TccC [Pseudomonas sp. GGS8]|uniref:RHS repeat-associated core domain-containing protein n=1 Tax=Pseudomonas sp. GGS8 TaxID=2817892 RepID=UPI00209F7AE9|nr:RHS repeat-associated core domain-containing protein [Pseudomonas sp. GGS8]MCP1441298.1 insecticidal toxin complex protein TccC [Pseudomonas sp. GGS8]